MHIVSETGFSALTDALPYGCITKIYQQLPKVTKSSIAGRRDVAQAPKSLFYSI